MLKKLLTLSFLLLFSTSFAQNLIQELQKKADENYQIPRETAYLHLNKSVYLKGEQIAFTAYILDRENLQPFTSATNLYLLVRDASKKIVNEQMLLINQGVTSNTIKIDSTFVPGDYTITAFTNWMRNFDEQNYFLDQIEIIDPASPKIASSNNTNEAIDLQFLPESGHLLNGILNSVGVIAKTNQGLGIANLQVQIKDANNSTLSDFKLNHLGIGKFVFIPKTDASYSAMLKYPDGSSKVIPVDLNTEAKGIILTATNTLDRLHIAVKTNTESLKTLVSENYVLMLHNRKGAQLQELNFTEKTTQEFVFELEQLPYGVQTFTLINSERQAIAERIVFNHHNLPTTQFETVKSRLTEDSIEVTLKPKKQLKNPVISASILPKKVSTNASIRANHLLKPYVKGYIQEPEWYFTNIDAQKIQELDKLLITQGWSSFDWNTAFKNPAKIDHPFENLIAFEATINKPRKEQQFLIHASETNPPQTLTIPSEADKFIVDNLIHYADQELNISRMTGRRLVLPDLNLRFSPNTFPNLQSTIEIPFKIDDQPVQTTYDPMVFLPEPNTELLDEVLITSTVSKEKLRERKLGLRSFGRVKVLTDRDRKNYGTLVRYLNNQVGLRARESQGQFIVTKTMGTLANQYNPDTNGNPTAGATSNGTASNGDNSVILDTAGSDLIDPGPYQGIVIFLDDAPIADNNFFYNYSLEQVDYIDINLRGFGNGLIGSNGSIKIYTDNKVVLNSPRYSNPQKFKVPVAFSVVKKYYVPKFNVTNDAFFERYGVIDWKPQLKLDEKGTMHFKIKRPDVDYKMVFQGISEDGILLHDVQEVSLEQEPF